MKDSNPYISTTKNDLSEMLLEIGVNKIDDLYSAVPQKLAVKQGPPITIPSKKSWPSSFRNRIEWIHA